MSFEKNTVNPAFFAENGKGYALRSLFCGLIFASQKLYALCREFATHCVAFSFSKRQKEVGYEF